MGMGLVMQKGSTCSVEFLTGDRSIRKLDGTVLHGSPGALMIHYPNGDGDIMTPSEFKIKFVEFRPVTEEFLEDLQPPRTEEPPIPPVGKPIEPTQPKSRPWRSQDKRPRPHKDFESCQKRLFSK